jgi:hypothetical protein
MFRKVRKIGNGACFFTFFEGLPSTSSQGRDFLYKTIIFAFFVLKPALPSLIVKKADPLDFFGSPVFKRFGAGFQG